MTAQARSAEHVSSDGAHQDASGWNGLPKAASHRYASSSATHLACSPASGGAGCAGR